MQKVSLPEPCTVNTVLFSWCVQERLVSVVYGLLMQSKLHFLTALREGILTNLKYTVKEVRQHTHSLSLPLSLSLSLTHFLSLSLSLSLCLSHFLSLAVSISA